MGEKPESDSDSSHEEKKSVTQEEIDKLFNT
jgi:hypothetical protein